MKRLITILLSVVFLVSSCENYLNVTPKDQLARSKALSKQQTYYDALNGVYLMLGSNELFGHHLTYGMIEQMSRNHSIKPTDAIFHWQYSDTNVLGMINRIWSEMYTAIANVI